MKIANDVLLVLEQATVSGNELFLNGTLDRKMYVAVNKVLEAAGGKWNKKSKCHVFDSSAEDRIEQIILTGEVEIPKDDFEFFPTPNSLVEKMAHESGILNHSREQFKNLNILEPNGGKGAISDYFHELGCKVDIVELSPQNYEYLKSRHQCKNLFFGDFLKFPLVESYDYVFMNPPFSKQQDIDHVLHAYKFLKPDGVLVAIMAASVLWRENKKTIAFRQFVEDHNGTIEKLPEGTFKGAGTMVNTVMVVMTK